MKPSKYKVSSLRESEHKGHVAVGLDQVHGKSKGKNSPVSIGGYITHHVPASQASSFPIGSQVNVGVTPAAKKRPVKFGSPGGKY